MARKRPWHSRLHRVLAENIVWTHLPADSVTARGLLPRLATDTHVRVVTLRTQMDDGRTILTDMTPEQAIDLGKALINTGRQVGTTNLHTGSGWIVNTASTTDGWTTGTASAHPAPLERPAGEDPR